VTLLAPARPRHGSEPGKPGLAGRGRAWWPHVWVCVLLVCWSVPFTHASGGRGVHALLVFALVTLAAFVALAGWRLPARELAAATVLAAAAVAVCVRAATGWAGMDAAAGYVVAAAAYLVTRRYADGPSRRTFVLAAVCLAGVEQFGAAFLPWWGGRDSSAQMTGTFYWHNPYAAFLLPGAILGLGLALRGERPWRLVGWVSAPLCTAGVVFSSSRATLAVLAAGWVAVLATSVRCRRLLRRAAGVTLVTAGAVLLLPGPPFFDHWRSPFAATASRAAAGETIGQNGHYRMQFWREAVAVFRHHPIHGAGYHSLATASALYTPTGWARSPLAHNGYLQALTDGGLLLAGPFLFALAVVAWRAARPLLAAARRPLAGADPVDRAVQLVVLGALAHSAVDFDWSHPSILVELALLAGCLAPKTVVLQGFSAVRRTLAGLLVVTLAFSGVALHTWQRTSSAAANVADTTAALRAGGAVLGDYRPARLLAFDAAGGKARLTHAQAVAVVGQTAAASRVDIQLALARAAVAAQFRLGPGTVAAAERAVAHLAGSTEPYVLGLAEIYRADGQERRAVNLVRAELAAQRRRGAADPDTAAELQFLAARADSRPSAGCLALALAPLLPTPPGVPVGCPGAGQATR
jgi:O-antigen ligase